MSVALAYAANLVAITVLVFGLYFPRHHRRDLVVAYLGVNVGVMAVSTVLLSGAAGLGLGLGLFGVLSIIRLRSDELAQHEVAYYFSSLALGLLSGLSATSMWLTWTLMVVIVATARGCWAATAANWFNWTGRSPTRPPWWRIWSSDSAPTLREFRCSSWTWSMT